ncbi:MAG: hypothetical protein AAF827_23640 [Cyanobacteria bacterium P01_D01_bin.6]
MALLIILVICLFGMRLKRDLRAMTAVKSGIGSGDRVEGYSQ